MSLRNPFSAGGWRRRWDRWIDRRIPRSPEVSLHRGNVFIFPSAEGGWFLLLLLVLLLTAINYQNSLLYLLTFLLGGLFMGVIMATYQALAGLRVIAGNAGEGFPGEAIVFRLTLERLRGGVCPALQVWIPGGSEDVVAVRPAETKALEVSAMAHRRGPFPMPRVRLQTTYPLGLLRAWTWIALDLTALVYPAPLAGVAPDASGAAGAGDQKRLRPAPGQEDFRGVRDYVPGDSMRRIDWKRYARDEQLRTRVFEGVPARSGWIDFDDYVGMETETRLSRMCHDLLERLGAGEEVGLKLRTVTVPPGLGELHQHRCLEALGRFGFEENANG